MTIRSIDTLSTAQRLAGRGTASQKAIDQQAFRLFHQQALDQAEVKVSNHAIKRLNQRNITLEAQDLIKIGETLTQAEAKGAKESVVFYKDLTLIASIPNRTIITAMTAYDQTDGIFTNVDSAIVVKD